MRGLLLMIAVSLSLLGCQTTPERAVQPLPLNAGPFSYHEIVDRARAQVSATEEFFYRDRWKDVEQAGTAIQETSSLFSKLQPEEIPARTRESLPKLRLDLKEAGTALGEAAKAQDIHRTVAALQRLHLTIREMRAE